MTMQEDESDLPGPRINLPGLDVPGYLNNVAHYLDFEGGRLCCGMTCDAIAAHHCALHDDTAVPAIATKPRAAS